MKEVYWNVWSMISSLQPMSSIIRLNSPMRCGRRILPISKVKGWGWYYLSTVIDDYSRYIIHWELCSSMTSEDVSRTIDKAVEKAGVTLQNPPCLLSDNGPCYIASSLKEYLGKVYNIKHIHGKPLHPQTQGKIERYHRSMKNVIKLNHYFCPSEL